jgi:hypothetical protein
VPDEVLVNNPIVKVEAENTNLHYNYMFYPELQNDFNHIVNVESIIGV